MLLPLPRRAREDLVVQPVHAQARALALTTAAFPEFRAGRRPRPSFSRPARHSLALRPVCLPSRYTTLFTESFDVVITFSVASIATGWSDQLAGWDFHPLEKYAFARRTEKT
jgi:hypothetical protein